MTPAEQMAAVRLYLDVIGQRPEAAAAGIADTRAELESDPDALLARISERGAWPDLLWVLVQGMLAADKADRDIWYQRWSTEAAMNLDKLQALHATTKAAAQAHAKANRVTHKDAVGPTRQRVDELTEAGWKQGQIAKELTLTIDAVKKARAANRRAKAG